MNSPRILIIVILSIPNLSCGLMLDIFLDTNESNAQRYDEMKCKHGPASPPGQINRIGCVNAYTEFENEKEYRRYRNQLELYKVQTEDEGN